MFRNLLPAERTRGKPHGGSQVYNKVDMAKKTKKCPFCAETIKIEAIVCRHCGRDLPNVSGSNSNLGPARPEVPTNQIIADKVYKNSVQILREGKWKLLLQPEFIPFRCEPRKYTKALLKLGTEAWEKGGQTPEGAIEWMQNNEPSVGLFTASLENSHASNTIKIVFYRHVKRAVMRDFQGKLEAFINEIVPFSKSNSEALSKVAPFSHNLPSEYKKDIIDEAIKYINSITITEEEYVPSPPLLGDMIDEVNEIVQELTNKLLVDYRNAPVEKRGLFPEIAYEKVKSTVEKRVGGEKRFDGTKSLIVLHVNENLRQLLKNG